MSVTLSPGSDVRQRSQLRQLLANSQAWQDWTEEADAAARLARVGTLSMPGTNVLPAAVVAPGGSRRDRRPPGSERNSVTAAGELLLMVFDALDTEVDEAADEERFAGNLSQLADQLMEDPQLNGWAAGTRFSSVEIPKADGWQLSEEATQDDLDADPQPGEFVGRVWIGQIIVRWGFF